MYVSSRRAEYTNDERPEARMEICCHLYFSSPTTLLESNTNIWEAMAYENLEFERKNKSPRENVFSTLRVDWLIDPPSEDTLQTSIPYQRSPKLKFLFFIFIIKDLSGSFRIPSL